MLQQVARDFLMLLVTVDPVGAVALFVPLTASMTAAERARVARRGSIIAAIVLLAFLVAGQVVLSHLGVRLVSFQLAGGVILFLFGLQMVFGTGVAAHGGAAEPGHDVAVFPVALPAIASPGAIMAVVLLTDNHRQSISEQAMTAVVLLVVLAITYLSLRASGLIHRVLGATGANVLIRVMGLVLAALATEQVVAGVEALMRGGAE